MKKNLLIGTMALMTVLAGCTTTAKIASNQQSVAQMQVAPIKLKFSQKHYNPVFYDENTLQNKLTACIQDELSKAGKLSMDSGSPTLVVNLDYKRTYMGEAFGMKSNIADVRFGFDYQIVQQGQVLQYKTVKDRLVHQFGNNTTQDSEDKFIRGVCNDIVKVIH